MTDDELTPETGIENFKIRLVRAEDREMISQFMDEHYGGEPLFANGSPYMVGQLSGFVAKQEDRLLALVTYIVEGDSSRIITINSLAAGVGLGTELLKATIKAAAEAGCNRVCAAVTNDNLDALRFFQTRGFILGELRHNIVDTNREQRPDYPTRGLDGIMIRDEIEVEINF